VVAGQAARSLRSVQALTGTNGASFGSCAIVALGERLGSGRSS
jgi:hypothetical protein